MFSFFISFLIFLSPIFICCLFSFRKFEKQIPTPLIFLHFSHSSFHYWHFSLVPTNSFVLSVSLSLSFRRQRYESIFVDQNSHIRQDYFMPANNEAIIKFYFLRCFCFLPLSSQELINFIFLFIVRIICTHLVERFVAKLRKKKFNMEFIFKFLNNL